MDFGFSTEPINGKAINEIRILPDGLFRTNDGRPDGIAGWRIDTASAAQVIMIADQGGGDILIDYEHQSLLAKTNGAPVPAAGWFRKMEWRPGFGLFALDVRWTARAQQMITSGEYRYISPVFQFDPSTGVVLKIISVALTNNPAIPSLVDFAALTLANQNRPTFQSDRAEDQRGLELLQRMFGANPAVLTVADGNLPKFHSTRAEDQRGMELLNKMVEASRLRPYG